MSTSVTATVPNILVRFVNAILGSKKAVAAIATVIFTFLAPKLADLGITISEAELEKVIGIAIAYLVGQGIADSGKEAAKIKAAAGPDTTTNTAVSTTAPVVVNNTTAPATASGELETK